MLRVRHLHLRKLRGIVGHGRQRASAQQLVVRLDHRGHDVLAGEAEFTVGEEVFRTGPGSYVAAPIGVVHGFRNAGDGELRMLNVHAPNTGFSQRLRR